MSKLITTTMMMCLAAGAAAQPTDPQQLLGEMLSNADKAEAAWVALRATDDADLRPMLDALSRSEDASRRRFAVEALAEMFKVQAADVIAERAFGDSDRLTRLEAAARLLWLEGVGDQHVDQALASKDEEVRSMAADTMVRRGRGFAAVDELRRLAESSNVATACSARLNMLALGHQEFLAPVEQVVADEKTSEAVLRRILAQIGEDKIAAAGELALRLAESDRPNDLRLAAWRAVSKVVPAAATLMAEAIGRSELTAFRVELLAMLAEADQSRSGLESVAKGEGAVATLATFELARAAGGEQAAAAAVAAVALEHPVAVDYVLDRAEIDAEKDAQAASCYMDAMLKIIAQANAQTSRMAADHLRAARASTLLADMGSEPAIAALRELLQQRYTPVVRAVGAGLVRSKNRGISELVRPLLDSPHEELSTDAALVLGGFGDAAARARLEQYASDKYPPPLAAMSAWYLLKISGRTASAAQQLATQVK